MTSVVDDTLDAYVSVISLAVKFKGLIVNGAKLMILAYLLLLAGQLQDDEIFGEHIGLDLGIVLVATGGAVQKLLLLVHDRKTLLAHRVPAV